MPPQFRFDCPACVVETTVDSRVRAEILANGCVICEASVGSDAFCRPSGGER
jgi:transcription elongation factor Elf1